ncbi:MAG: AAA family ATPase [Chloroflexi bacterium]|nr:AAA family ATPase [Chloroflexota bacterium]
MLDPLNRREEDDYLTRVKAQKELHAPEASAIKEGYIRTRAITRAEKDGISLESAEEIVRQRCTGTLHPDDQIRFHSGDVTVSELLANPMKYDGKPCADPHEPEEGTSRAKFYANTATGKPLINSMLHGRSVYYLTTSPAFTPLDQDEWPAKLGHIGFQELLNSADKPPDWLIEGYIESGSLGCVFGASGSYKTFLTLDMALSVASGKDWHGKPVKQGAVYYFFGEGSRGFGRRVKAWMSHHGINGKIPFHGFNNAVSMNEKNLEDLKLAIDKEQPILVIVDTLNRHFDGNENDTGDMTKFITALDEIGIVTGDTAKIIVHHTGNEHSNRGRGSSALRASMDFEFRTEADGNGVSMTNTKSKDSEMPEPIFFTKTSVSIGLNSNSLIFTTGTRPPTEQKLGSREKELIEILQETPCGLSSDDIWRMLRSTEKGRHIRKSDHTSRLEKLEKNRQIRRDTDDLWYIYSQPPPFTPSEPQHDLFQLPDDHHEMYAILQ